MLIIGSRALRRSFPDTRVALDWDVVGTTDELAALRGRLEPVYEHAWTKNKAYFVFEERPFEFIVASSAWEEVLALGGIHDHYPGLGTVTYAAPETLLMLKLSHVHLTHHWRKTARDVDLLLSRGVSLTTELEPLLEKLRRHAESRRGADACSFGPPMRVFPDAASPAIESRRRSMLGDSTGRWLDGSRPHLARALPRSREDAASFLATLAMVHAVEHDLLPAFGESRPSRRAERDAVDSALEALCTDVLGRAVRLSLAPHAELAARKIPTGFAHSLLRTFASASTAFGRGAYRPPPSRPSAFALDSYIPR